MDNLAIGGLDNVTKTKIQEERNLLKDKYQKGILTEAISNQFLTKLESYGFQRKTMPAFVSLYSSLSTYNYSEDDLIKILNDKMIGEASHLIKTNRSGREQTDLAWLGTCEFKCFTIAARISQPYYEFYMLGCVAGCKYL